MAVATYHVPFIDYSKESSAADFPVDSAILDAALTAFLAALENVVLGNTQPTTLRLATPKDAGTGGIPVDDNAQRERKYLCRYHDAVTGRKYTLEIPCADSSILAAASDFADLTAGFGGTFKTQFETIVVAKLTENAVVLDSMQLVGRNI